MADPLEVELAALGRLSTDLHALASSLQMKVDTPSVSATPDASVDMPSLVAARPVSLQTIPDLQGKVADRFLEVAYLVDQARTNFAKADDDRASLIADAGSLLPG